MFIKILEGPQPMPIILPGIAVNGTVASEEVTNWLKTIGYEL
ncbi:MAG: hypothetical protein AAGU27_03730 [Dehalobacterium sp.]